VFRFYGSFRFHRASPFLQSFGLQNIFSILAENRFYANQKAKKRGISAKNSRKTGRKMGDSLEE